MTCLDEASCNADETSSNVLFLKTVGLFHLEHWNIKNAHIPFGECLEIADEAGCNAGNAETSQQTIPPGCLFDQKISRLSSFINNTIKHFSYVGEASIFTDEVYLSFYRSICVYSA